MAIAAMRRRGGTTLRPRGGGWGCPMCDARARCASAVAARRSATRRPSPRTLPSMPLGLPLPPADEHAISASMPLWSDVVGYEEGDTWVHAQLALGYPRFVYHPSTQELFEHLEDTRGDGDEAMVVFPSAAAAGRCQAFVERSLRGLRAHEPLDDAVPRRSRLVPVVEAQAPRRGSFAGAMDLTAVAVPHEHEALLKSYWQHTGELISSRVAGAVLQQLQAAADPAEGAALATEEASASLCNQLAELAGGDTQPSDVYLFQSGMAAIYSAHRLASALAAARDPAAPLRRSAMFGFPYLDTLKILRQPPLSAGAEFFANGDDRSLRALRQLLSTPDEAGSQLQAVFTEHPTNPLLQVPPLAALSEAAATARIPLIVDDTVGFGHYSLLEGAAEGSAPDVVVSSLSKVFSGAGNCMGCATPRALCPCCLSRCLHVCVLVTKGSQELNQTCDAPPNPIPLTRPAHAGARWC